MSNEQIFNLAGEIFDIAKENNCTIWLDHGTLLGIVRDGDILPWDTDFDISVFEEDFDRAKKALLEILRTRSDLTLKISNRYVKIIQKNSQIKIDISKYRSVDGMFQKTLIDRHHWKVFRIIKSHIDYLVNNLNRIKIKNIHLLISLLIRVSDLFGKVCLSEVPQKYFSAFEEIELKGGVFIVPVNATEYLAYRYGDDWLVPNRNWSIYKNDRSLI